MRNGPVFSMLVARRGLLHVIEGAASYEPLQLVGIKGVGQLNFLA